MNKGSVHLYIQCAISLDPVITLTGGPELHIKHGSQINISCSISDSPVAIDYVIWFKDGEIILAKEDQRIDIG